MIDITKLTSRQKTSIVIIHDLALSISSFYLAFAIRYDSILISAVPLKTFLYLTIIASSTQVLTFYFLGLYRGIWRYSSIPDLTRIIRASTIATLVTFLSLFIFNRLNFVPRSLFFIDWALLILSLGAGRFAYRLWSDQRINRNISSNSKRTLIVGANDRGTQIYREIKNSQSLKIHVIGFLDDNPEIRQKYIYNTPILGSLREISEITKTNNIDLILIALPEIKGQQLNALIKEVDPGIRIKILPKLEDHFQNKANFSQLRSLKVEDLLGRDVVELDTEHISSMLHNKSILITGAGGSIGSEICRQVLKFKPRTLILLDQSELNLYLLEQELSSSLSNSKLEVVVGNIQDQEKANELFKNHQPEVIFHAAAYKHVPLMEKNPYEAIQTNVKGTKIISELAAKYQAERFIMISTDKAVNPTNIMGASKRVAELICQKVQSTTSITKFTTVRFGNVLGSSGSVIPLFKNQIEKGGPVTVTHKDVTRYFMSIPEASQLVLQAATIGNGGEVFVLDMGQPVNIYSLAKQMISLSGFVPDQEIKIKITGLRPGEKLFEELLTSKESTLPTRHPKVKIAKASYDPESFDIKINQLLNLKSSDSIDQFREKIITLVSEFLTPEEHIELNNPNEPGQTIH